MATYIQGITDYLPTLQPFQPDYNFLSNVLQTKQSRYDAAHKQLSSVYGTLLNSPMLRDQNIERRDQFFKSIDQDIQRMSGMDLSLQQNQDIAMNVFKGFYEDKNMVKDMLWTKNYMNEQSRAEAFKECIDKDKCGGSWWEGGVKALDYKAQEFKAASDKDALNFENVSFTPAQDFMGKAMKLAKDSGFSIKYDEVKGDWIVTTKNGKEMIKPLAEFYISQFGSDPKMMDYYKKSAYVRRKDWVAQNLVNYNNDESAATMAYVAQVYSETKPMVDAGKKDADATAIATQNESNQIDKYVRENGYIPSMNLINDWNNAKSDNQMALQSQQVYTDAHNKLEALGYNQGNIKFVVDQLDDLMGLSMLKSASLNAASAYASLTSEMELKANPYAVQAKQQAFEMKKLKAQWEHEEQVRQEAMKELTKDGKITPSLGKSAWSATDVTEKLRAYNTNVQARNQVINDLDNSKKDQLKLMLSTAQKVYADKTKSYEDLSGMLTKTFNGTGIDPQKFLNNDAAEMAKYNKLLEDPNKWVSMYSAIDPYTDPTNGYGALQKDWVSTIQPQLTTYKNKLNESRTFIKAFDAWNKKQGDQIADKVVANWNKDPESNTLKGDAFSAIFKASSKDGFEPAGGVSLDQVINNRGSVLDVELKKWAAANQDKFEAEVRITSPSGEVKYTAPRGGITSLYTGQKIAPKSNAEYDQMANQFFDQRTAGLQDVGITRKSAYDKALEFARSSYADGIKDWQVQYHTSGTAWDNAKEGGASNAKQSMAGTGIVDAAALNTQSGKTMLEMFDNYQNLKDEAIVLYGNNLGSDKSGGTNTAAQSILDQFITDFRQGSPLSKEGLPTKSDRAIADFDISRIAAQDPNLMGFRIKPSYSWGKQYRSSSGKTDKLIDTDDYIDQGIVVYLPKDKVKGEFMTKSAPSMWDFIMDTQGQVSVNSPSGGTASLTYVNGQYNLLTTVDVVNPDGTKSKVSSSSLQGLDFDLPTFVETYQQGLDYQAIINQQSLFNIAAQTGVKDPNQLFNQ